MYNLFENRAEIPSFDSSENYLANPTRINIRTLGEIAQTVFDEPRIAVYEVTVEEKVSPFFEEVSETKNSYYIIGEGENMDKLISKDESDRLSLAENNRNIRNISRDDILFLLENEDIVNKLNSSILELKLDLETHNFMWTTTIEDLDKEKLVNLSYPRTEDEDNLRLKKVLISENSINKNYDNVFIKYEHEAEEFDFMYKRSLNVIAAQSGNLKSTTVNNIIAAAVKPTNDIGFTFLDEDRKDDQIIIFDTETNENHLYQKWNFYTSCSSKLTYITLKNIPTRERLRYVHSVINRIVSNGSDIRAIIIDSLMDFIYDFNNNEESQILIESILQVINLLDIPAIVTYQENPARYNGAYNKLSGHLGTKLHQKSESHYKTSVFGNTANLACVKNRNESRFTISYDLNTTGDFLILENAGLKDKTKTSVDKKLDKLIRSLDIAFVGKKSLANDELIAWIMETLDIKSRAASDWKQKLVDSDLIENANSSGKANQWVKK